MCSASSQVNNKRNGTTKETQIVKDNMQHKYKATQHEYQENTNCFLSSPEP